MTTKLGEISRERLDGNRAICLVAFTFQSFELTTRLLKNYHTALHDATTKIRKIQKRVH